jgi:hypothetical protein
LNPFAKRKPPLDEEFPALIVNGGTHEPGALVETVEKGEFGSSHRL